MPLPIDPLLPEIARVVRAEGAVVLEAPPGAGKTTRVPPTLAETFPGGEVIVLEPRRIAARLAARRVASDLGEEVGGRVGYQVRFEDVSSAKTRIRFVTEGIFARRLLGDPELAGVAAVVLDEFHERHLATDVTLALTHRLRATQRPDLALVVMSATLDAEPVARFLRCPTIRAEGRAFEVAIEHAAAPDDRNLELRVASAVRQLVREGLDGDVLVFLPGAAEIRRASTALEKMADEHGLLLVPLHGDLPGNEQDRAVRRADRRKIILSTNVAESSVTIDGVVAVVDSGLVRVAGHAPWSGLPSLRIEKTSRASAIQRAGRAGRTGPGRCLRLYTRADFESRPEHDLPEIARLDLAQTLLELAASGRDGLAWLDAPPTAATTAARELLERLGAIDSEEKITPIGRRMLEFPVHPRLARMLVEAESRGVLPEASVFAALVSERDIRSSARSRFGAARASDRPTERSDLSAVADLFFEAEASRFSADALRSIGLDPGATHSVARAKKQLERKGSPRAQRPETQTAMEDALGMAVLAGYPDRVARRRRPGSRDLALSGGGMAELAEDSVVRDAEWLVAVDAESRPGRPALVRLASALDPSWLLDLFETRVRETTEVTWDREARRASAVSRMLYEGLVLTESARATDESEIAERLAAEALAVGPAAFAAEGVLERWLARARYAQEIDPSVAAPTDAAVRATLAELCHGLASFAELEAAGLFDVLQARLGPASLARIEALAPDRLSLGSGRVTRVEYEAGKPPWVESYLQDFMGMKKPPQAGGRPIVLHLLAPNRRAVQVTTDLSGFWERHYPSIRKELARKYPRHAWPEDPSQPVPMKVRR